MRISIRIPVHPNMFLKSAPHSSPHQLAKLHTMAVPRPKQLPKRCRLPIVTTTVLQRTAQLTALVAALTSSGRKGAAPTFPEPHPEPHESSHD